MNIEIMMRPSIVSKLVGAIVCVGLSIYNIASSSDQVLIRSANPLSSRTEVRVFESSSKHLNMTSGAVFGLFGCGLVFSHSTNTTIFWKSWETMNVRCKRKVTPKNK